MSNLGLAFGRGKAICIPEWAAVIMAVLMVIGFLVVANKAKSSIQAY